MTKLADYLDCGHYYPYREAGDFCVTKISDITDKIIPFFDRYPIVGVKALDLADFRRVATMIKTKAHLTSDGLEQIRLIKSGMNRGR